MTATDLQYLTGTLAPAEAPMDPYPPDPTPPLPKPDPFPPSPVPEPTPPLPTPDPFPPLPEPDPLPTPQPASGAAAGVWTAPWADSPLDSRPVAHSGAHHVGLLGRRSRQAGRHRRTRDGRH